MLFPELAAALGILLRPLKGDLNREALPSFIAMLLKRGEGAFSVFLSFLAGLRTLFYRRFEASKSATIKLPFEKPSVLHCHAVKVRRRVLFPELAAALGVLLWPFRSPPDAVRPGSGAKQFRS